MTQFTPIRGFVNTPVSRSVCVLAAVGAVGASLLSVKHYFNLQIDPFILEYGQYWRVALFQLAVVNESDFLLTVLLWFSYKNLERFYGSRRYLSLVAVFALYNALCCFIAMCLGSVATRLVAYVVYAKLGLTPPEFDVWNRVAAGPLGLLSSLYVCYGRIIPVSYRFRVLLSPEDAGGESAAAATAATAGLNLTNHFQIHLLYTLLFLNHGFSSVLPCLVGLFLGFLHVNELLPGAKWMIPAVVFRAFIHPRDTLLARRHDGYVRLGSPSQAEVLSMQSDDADPDAADAADAAAEPPRPLGSQLWASLSR
ncbi:Derlin [[Candida] zeylanoides]